MFQLFNPAPLLFTLTTMFGVLVHDTQIDKATIVAITIPAAYVSYAAVDAVNKSGDAHTHVERVSYNNRLNALRSPIQRLQPRDDDLPYMQAKKVHLGGGENTSLWPSV